jgi:hypothetical protein
LFTLEASPSVISHAFNWFKINMNRVFAFHFNRTSALSAGHFGDGSAQVHLVNLLLRLSFASTLPRITLCLVPGCTQQPLTKQTTLTFSSSRIFVIQSLVIALTSLSLFSTSFVRQTVRQTRKES